MSMTYDLAANALRRFYDCRISTPAVLSADEWFPQAQRFHDHWQDIALEADHVARDILRVPRFHELMPEQASISANDDRDWRMFVLKAYGVGIAGNLARCPFLARLLAEVPAVTSASLSFLAPGKTIPCHRGPFRGVLRFHLMLSVPRARDGKPESVLEVDGVHHRLVEGDHLLWDDTYPHAAWNRGESIRTALLLDVLRPRMPADLAVLSRAVITMVGGVLRLRSSLRAIMEGRQLPMPGHSRPTSRGERDMQTRNSSAG